MLVMKVATLNQIKGKQTETTKAYPVVEWYKHELEFHALQDVFSHSLNY